MILLVRHGHALGPRTSDEERVLSAEGRDEVRTVARALAARGLRPGRVVASPLVRAVQTAEILAALTEHRGIVEVDDALVPEGDPWRAETLLRAASTADPTQLVVAVTHEPIVRVIAARLLGQPTFPAFRTAQCVLVEGARATLSLHPGSA
jgi:phosphohistidine phosphatase